MWDWWLGVVGVLTEQQSGCCCCCCCCCEGCRNIDWGPRAYFEAAHIIAWSVWCWLGYCYWCGWCVRGECW